MRGGRSAKKYSRKRNFNKKNSCTPSNPKKYTYTGLKNSYKGNGKENKIPQSPHNFIGPATGCPGFMGVGWNLNFVKAGFH